MTREEVVEIMNYCKEHKVTYKSRLEELNMPKTEHTHPLRTA